MTIESDQYIPKYQVATICIDDGKRSVSGRDQLDREERKSIAPAPNSNPELFL